MPPMPENVAGRAIHTFSPLREVDGLLASISLSNRRMKAELRVMVNTRKMVLPMNIVTQEVNSIQFREQDKAGLVYLNFDPLVIKTNIMGVKVHRLLVDSGAFCNTLFKKTLDEISDFTDYVELCEHVVKGSGRHCETLRHHPLSNRVGVHPRREY